MSAQENIRLNEMNSLYDLGLFPLTVCAGAVLNVLLTIAITRLLVGSDYGIHRAGGVYRIGLAAWIVIVLAVNLLPVVVLRLLTLRPGATFRPVRKMSFVADQHRFPLWVYVLASFNMTVWVVISWKVFERPASPPVHLLLVVAAAIATGFPAWIRWVRR